MAKEVQAFPESLLYICCLLLKKVYIVTILEYYWNTSMDDEEYM